MWYNKINGGGIIKRQLSQRCNRGLGLKVLQRLYAVYSIMLQQRFSQRDMFFTVRRKREKIVRHNISWYQTNLQLGLVSLSPGIWGEVNTRIIGNIYLSVSRGVYRKKNVGEMEGTVGEVQKHWHMMWCCGGSYQRMKGKGKTEK